MDKRIIFALITILIIGYVFSDVLPGPYYDPTIEEDTNTVLADDTNSLITQENMPYIQVGIIIFAIIVASVGTFFIVKLTSKK